MPYTFGAATGDDMTFIAGSNGFGNGTHSFIAGWWYPTTLTAGRGYFSFGNVAGVKVGTTTSELQMVLDATVDGVWNTSGAGITTNKWWFLAFLQSATNTGMAAAWRVWVGDEITRPRPITPTQATAPTTSFTGSTSRTLGNIGTGTVAFQGDIGWALMASQAHASALRNPIHQSLGTISAAEELLCEQTLVVPLWMGFMPPGLFLGATNVPTFNVCHLPLEASGNVVDSYSSSTTVTPLALTLNGATLTQNAPPIRLNRGSVYVPRLVRR